MGPFSVSSLRKPLHAACARLTDSDGQPLPVIHPPVLRHSFASWRVNDAGVSLKTAQVMLEHRNVATTRSVFERTRRRLGRRCACWTKQGEELAVWLF